MVITAKHGLEALTEKEKETLRLIVRGHDAKSVARTLGLSVHTINERLREARRKLAVSSSREAARRLLEAEDATVASVPKTVRDKAMGDVAIPPPVQTGPAPIPGAGRRRPWLTIGAVLMIPTVVLLALVAVQLDGSPPAAPVGSSAGQSPATVANPAAAEAAQRFLTLIDQARWDDSFAAAGASFRKVNTVKLWADTSRQVRAPLGAVIARTLLSADPVAAPPRGFQLVKFRTQFANRPDAAETVTLDREHGQWRVVGITIE